MISVLIVDDHEIMRRGLVDVLQSDAEIDIVGTGANGKEAVKQANILKPSVVLMDIKMPILDGIGACRLIKRANPGVKVIILTAIEDSGDIFQAIEAGADGYMVKDTAAAELLRAVKVVADGGKYLHPTAAGTVMAGICGEEKSRKCGEAATAELTSQERKVLRLLAQGYKNREIADRLFVSNDTVKSHVSHILRKLGQPDRMRAVTYALRHGIIKME